MKAELRDLTPKPPREVVVTMSEEEAVGIAQGIALYYPAYPGVVHDLRQLLRRAVEEGR